MPRTQRAAVLVGLLAGAFIATGCSTVLSTMQPAQTTPGRHVRGGLGMGINIPVGQIADTLDAAQSIAEGASSSGSIAEDDVDEFLSGVVGLALNPPAVAGEFQARYGFHDRFDAGLRVATGGNIRLDGRVRFLDPRTPEGLYGSAGVGFSYASASFPIPSQIEEFIEVDDLSRIELDLPVLLGWSNEIYHVWFGPKLVVSFVSTGLTFRQEGPLDSTPERIDVGATNFMYVGQVGAAIGYKHVWIAFELTIGGIAGSAEITRNTSTIYDPSYSGLIIYPALGLMFQF
jgi:hypothetical protein